MIMITPKFLVLPLVTIVISTVASGQAARITFSAFNNGVTSPTDPENTNTGAAVVSSYQPLLNAYPAPGGNVDGANIGRTITWGAGFFGANTASNPGVIDHTHLVTASDTGNHVAFDNGSATMTLTFDQPVSIPSFHYAYFSGSAGAIPTFQGFTRASDTLPVVTVRPTAYPGGAYVWSEITAFGNTPLQKVVFSKGEGNFLQLDDLTINAVSAPSSQAQVSITKIDEAPSGPFNGFTAPSLNNTGTLAYYKFRTGILTKNGTTVTTIAGFDGTFSNYGDPAINSGGTVAYTGNFIDGGMGLFTGNGTTTTTVSNTNTSAFSFFGRPSINTSGTVAFYAKSGGLEGLYTRNGSSPISTIATNGGGTFTDFGDPVVNSTGTLGFQAQRASGAGGGAGVYKSAGGITTTLDDSSGATFRGFDLPTSINTSGTVAFIGTLKNFNGAIYKSDGTTLTLIAQSSLSLPYRNFSFSKPSINSAGLVAFRAGLNPSGEGLFISDGITDTKVILVGDALFGSTVSTLSLSTTALNDSNQLAFQYTLATGASGVALATLQSAPTGTPFQQWAAGKQLAGADALATADPDNDGQTNLEEFAFDGDPKSGATGGKRRADFASDGGSSYFTLTVPVRSGAVFSGTPPAATVDGVTYTVLADDDLNGSDLSAIRRDPIAAGLPALTGYDYHSFRLTTTADQSPRAFLRIRVSE